MSWLGFGILAVTALVAALFFLSVIEHAVLRLSRLSLKVLAERQRSPRFRLLDDLAEDPIQFLLPLQFTNQLILVSLSVLLTWAFFSQQVAYTPLSTFLGLVAMVMLVRQLFPRLITQSKPERALMTCLPLLQSFYHVLSWFSAPLTSLLRVFRQSDVSLGKELEEEASEEEIQAYLGVGEEAGIIEEDESELIQSALEFGDTLVREIMTPRTEIVAIEEKSTIAELRELIVREKYSRIPVYRENLDQVIGLVYVRNLLSHLGDGKGEDPIAPLIGKAWFVPDTKKVSELLKEMQVNAEHLAIVINEYGSVSGLATMEDVIEEIVGEIRDEDEVERVDLSYREDGSYLVRGGAAIETLEEALQIDLGDTDVTTVSGLVVGHLGKVPTSGEKIELFGLGIEVVNSDRKKIQSMRIRKVEAAPTTLLSAQETPQTVRKPR